MSAWAKFYEGREGREYQQYVEERYKPFIDAIKYRIRPHDAVMEIGCGTGAISHALATWSRKPLNVRLSATDRETTMVDISFKRLWDHNVATYTRDALKPSDCDVVHSHGMLEHFDDDMIRRVISAHGKAAQVHYVPGLYAEPSFGDERLMSVDAWWKICSPDQIITFNGGLDYALIFERRS